MIRVLNYENLPGLTPDDVDDILYRAAVKVAEEIGYLDLPLVVECLDSNGNVDSWDLGNIG
jgi:hypothetical protein